MKQHARWYRAVLAAVAVSIVLLAAPAIASAETAQVANWRRERIGDGRVLAASPLMLTAQRILSRGQATEAARAEVLAVMNSLAHEFLYVDVSLVDLDGSVLKRKGADSGEDCRK